MDDSTKMAVLNELLAREQAALVPRLFESTLFISRLSLADLRVCRGIAESARGHAESIAGLIQELGGVPGPCVHDLSTADLHFQELHRVLPRLIGNHEALIRKYELAVEHIGAEPRTVTVVDRILKRHQDELKQLRALRGDRAGVAPS